MKKAKSKKLVEFLKEDIADMLGSQGPQEEAPINDISLDQKVDHFLVQYERESVPTSKQFEGKKPSLKSIMSMLFEADEDEPADEDEAGGGDVPAPGGDTPDLGGGATGGADLGGGLDDLGGGDDAGGGGDGGAEQVPTPKINLANFTRNMARLVDNFEAVVNPKRILLNRTRAYLERNYNPAVAKEFLRIMDTEYNLSPESFESEEGDSQNPYAAGALDPIGGGG